MCGLHYIIMRAPVGVVELKQLNLVQMLFLHLVFFFQSFSIPRVFGSCSPPLNFSLPPRKCSVVKIMDRKECCLNFPLFKLAPGICMVLRNHPPLHFFYLWFCKLPQGQVVFLMLQSLFTKESFY